MDTFVDVEERITEGEQPEGTVYSSFGSVAIGNGSNVFRTDQSGSWWGASEWADAPARIDMLGNAKFTSIDISGSGYSKTVTFAQDAIPTSVSIGDLWVDTNDNNALYRAAAVGATTIAAGQWEAYPDEYKLDIVGGTYVTTIAVTAKVEILPDANTGIVAYASNGTSVVFRVMVDTAAESAGSRVGDVIIGDYLGGTGVLWDQTEGELIIKGDMTAGTIDGVAITAGSITGTTFKTAASGTRVEISSTDDDIRIYDSDGDEVFRIDDEGGFVSIKAKDTRKLTFDADGNEINLDTKTRIDGELDMRSHAITNVTTMTGNVSGNCTGSSGSCTGNASTASTASDLDASSNIDLNDYDIDACDRANIKELQASSWGSFGGDLDMNNNDIKEVDYIYAYHYENRSEVFDGNYKEVMSSIVADMKTPKYNHVKEMGEGWENLDHTKLHPSIKGHMSTRKGVEEDTMSLSGLVMVQNTALLDILKRLEDLEKGTN